MSNLWFNVQFGTFFWQWERWALVPRIRYSEYIALNPRLKQFKVYTAFGIHYD